MNKHFTKYTEFLENKEARQHRNWAVTYYLGEFEEISSYKCEVLQWENSNAKWYRMEPFENREEAGYGFTLYFWDSEHNQITAKIASIRPV